MESLTFNGASSELMNGDHSPNEMIDLNGGMHTTEKNEPPQSDSPPTYAEAFPPLSAAPTSGPNTGSAWGQNRPSSKVKQAASASKAIQSSNSSQVFRIPYEERKYKNLSPIVGHGEKQSEVIRDTMQKYPGTTIEVSVTKDQGLTVMISGKRDSAAKARRDIVNKLQTQASIEMLIPKEHHGIILGKEGKRLRELELSTQTKVTLPRDSDIVRIVGTKEGIDRARHEVQLISDEQAKLAFERLSIPKIYHPFICGPDNEGAKEIANMSGARINVPPPSVFKDELTVAGEKESVQRAVKVIMDIYKEKEKRCKTVSVEVKKTQHKYVRGPRRAGIQDVLRATGVSVEMPLAEADNETITLRGDPDKLGNALTMVYERANSVVTSELNAPKWLHRFIIGRKGQNIKKITQDLDNKIHVEFLEDKDKIIIEGSPNEVQAAENLLESSLRELKNTMSYTDIQVDQKWHRHIIGKNGSNIGRIKNETGTSINIPSDSDKSITIRIEGSPEGVAAAKAEILEMTKKMENEKSRDIIIEQRFHKNIIGQKGEKVREIRDQFSEVQISFPEAGSKSDVVSLRGPKDDVDKCYSYLKKLTAEMVASGYRLDVPIFKRFHGNIIGRNGTNIKKIKEETGTIIDIPDEKSDSNIIVITGYKEKTEKARKMILAIQSELANIITSEVKIPQKLHTSMIGQGGKLIQSIMTECGDVHIRFPPEGNKSDIITLRGTKEDVEKAEIQLKKLAEERLENSFTAEVMAKAEHHRFLIGRGGINIRKVREKTGVRIIFPTQQDENKEVITVIGKKEDVEKAQEELMSKIKDLNNIVEGEVMIDPKHHKYLVARRAQVLKDISDEYGGVNISLPKDTKSSKVSLKGAKDCVEGAKKRLLDMIEELELMVELKCVIPQRHHRSVLGSKGRNVQNLTSKLNVQIKFPDRRRGDDFEEATEVEGEENKNDVILVSGKKENAEEARDALRALVPISKEVTIPFENHRFLIGNGGANIRKMMDDYDVNISVPPAEKKNDVIVVTGPVKNVELALEALEKRNEEIEATNEDRKLSRFEMIITVPNKYHSKLIGRKGVQITKLRGDYGVYIKVPATNISLHDERADQITLVGYEENCEKAKAAIDAIIKELEDQLTLKVMIDQRIHSRIIGQKGKNVRKIMDQFKVDIRFPRQENPNLVLISGFEDNCEACREHLLMLEEEYMDEVKERMEERQLFDAYTKRNQGGMSSSMDGFFVKDAPWSQQSQHSQQAPPQPSLQQKEYVPDADDGSDFPTLCGRAGNDQQGKAWGPWGGH